MWSFYVDLEESIGSVESTKAVYDKIMDLRIANAQIIVNYASFLEENHYFEESFKVNLNFAVSADDLILQVYERGVEVFTFPISFEIWNIYLSKFVKRYVRAFEFLFEGYAQRGFQGGTKLERARDLFEQALEKCPPKSCKPLFLMYAQLEEDHGLARRSMAVLERGTKAVADEDKFEVSSFLTHLNASFHFFHV